MDYKKEFNFEDKFEEHKNLVYFTIHKYYPWLAGDEDIVQLGYIGLWKAIETYDISNSKFSTYAVKCIKDEILQHIKKLQALKRKTDIEAESYDALPLGVQKPDNDYEMVEYDFNNLKKHLKPKHFDIFMLYVNGYTLREIANMYGVSYQFIQQIIKKTQKKAKIWL